MADDDGNNRLRSLKEGFHHRDLRTTFFQFLTGVGKFAVDSTIFSSLKAVADKNQEHKIGQEGLKNASSRLPSLNEKKPEELKLLMDKKKAEMEEEGEVEHNNGMKQHHCTSANVVDASEPLNKFPWEDVKGPANVMENKKKIFIRSRL